MAPTRRSVSALTAGQMWHRTAVFGLLAVLMAAGSSLVAEEDPPVARREEPQVLLADVVADPSGEATRHGREALAALAADVPERAYEHLLTLAERHGNVLVPVSLFGANVPGRADGALRWRARRIANLALAGLPVEFRTRLEERWGPETAALWRRARRGSAAALRRLAREYGATTRGSAALLLLADRAFESGRLVQAARALEQWLELNTESPRRAQAAIVVRLVDALARIDDAGALDRVQITCAHLREEPVRAGGVTTSLAERVAAWRGRAQPVSRPNVLDASLLDSPTLLWSRSLEDPGLLREDHRDSSATGVTAGVWVGEDALVLHEGRVVRRLDPLTGLERWRFPETPRASVHDPRGHMHGFDAPHRSVTPAPGRVLVVLGTPAATGRYTFLDQEYDVEQSGLERRTRLACLDLASGRLLWTTGTADDTHPVLGHRAAGCASPPLVDGNDVYCVFALRLGATTSHLACLDLETGRPRWVVALAGGESGRSPDRGESRNRFTVQAVNSIPWGARPALAGGELCVVPHAGFAAGVDAADGAVRWVRALPRFARAGLSAAPYGQSVQNEPVAWGDAWLLAPMDSPDLLCLARRTGDLRWQRRGTTDEGVYTWRDLLGVGRGPDGRPQIRLSGWAPLLMDPADGAVVVPEHVFPWDRDGEETGGRALRVAGGVLCAAGGAVQAQPWSVPRGEQAPEMGFSLAFPGCPRAGDLYQAGPLFVVVGRDRIAALALRASVLGSAGRLASRGERGARPSGAAAIAETGLRAVLEGNDALLGLAIAGAVRRDQRAQTEPDARLWQLLAEFLQRRVEALEAREARASELRALAAHALAMPPRWGGAALARLVRGLFSRVGAEAEAVRIALRWLETADDTLIDAGQDEEQAADAGRLRGDLLAGVLIRDHAHRAPVRALLEAREAGAERRLREAEGAGEAALREALRRTAGTRAAAQARRRLLERMRTQGRFDAMADLAADLRLDPPWLDVWGPDPAAAREGRLRMAAALQLREAGWLARIGQGERARTLVAELAAWGPGGVRDDAGRTGSVLAEELRRRFGWYPVRRTRQPPVQLWQGVAPPEDRDEIRCIEILALEGPGAAALSDYVLLVRGLTLEIWSLKERVRIASLHGNDEGWFGGSLASVDSWVPSGGILVRSSVPGEPADASGAQAGDWLRRWDGRPVRDLPTFMNRVAASLPGSSIAIQLSRRGRVVLDRFTVGRRPRRQGRMLDYEPLWVGADGRVLLPGRTGLSWVDPRRRTRTPAWTWSEPGVVRRARVVGEQILVTIESGLFPDVVVALDRTAGREVWRREVAGRVRWVAPVGSGLWIQCASPARAFLVDRRTGRPRATWRCRDLRLHEFHLNWAPLDQAALAAGRGYFVSGTDAYHALSGVNTTTGRREFVDGWEHASEGPFERYRNPQVAASGFVAAIRGSRLRLYLPDPLGGQPRRALDADSGTLMTTDATPHWGSLDHETRIYARADTLYVLRLPNQGRRNVNVAAFGVDYGALLAMPSSATAIRGDGLHMRGGQGVTSDSSIPTRYVLDARAHFEGILVMTGQLTGDHRVEHWWRSALRPDGARANRDLRLLSGAQNEARRHVPVRNGERLFVSRDEGFTVFPVKRFP